jgi:beta-lactamase regulating signal transducer with metallopeptidase domain
VFDYLFSLQSLLCFSIALVFSLLMSKKTPYVCYALWLFVMIKLVLPVSLFENRIMIDSKYVDLVSVQESSYDSNDSVESQNIPLGFTSFIAKTIEKNAFKNFIQTDSLKSVDSSVPQNIRKLPYFLSFSYFYQTNKYILIGIWISISLIILYLILRQHQFLNKQLYEWKELREGPVYDTFLQLVKTFNISFVPKLYLAHSEECKSPFTTGYRRESTVVVLPDGIYYSEEPDWIRIALSHELCHISKHDQWVNLFRMTAKMLLHINPVRFVTDAFVNFYQEVTADLQTIQTLGISKKTYLKTLENISCPGDSFGYMNRVVSPFSIQNHIFMQRFYHVRDYIAQNQRKYLLNSIVACSLMAVFFTTNTNLYANYLSVKQNTVVVDPTNPTQSFPIPLDTLDEINHTSIQTFVYNDTIWVLEQYQGVYVYEVGTNGIPVLSSTYFPKIEQRMVLSNIEFYSDYAYLAIKTSNPDLLHQSRIEILDIHDRSQIKKVGEINNTNPISIKLADSNLWVGSTPEDYIEGGLLEIYDLSKNPVNPDKKIDIDEFIVAITNLYFDDLNHLIYAISNKTILVYDSISYEYKTEISFGYSPGYINRLDHEKLLISGSDFNLLNQHSSHFFSLIHTSNNMISILSDNEIKLEKRIDEKTHFSDIPTVINDCVLFPFYDWGTALFQVEDNSFEFIAHTDDLLVDGVIFNNQVIFFYEKTHLYDKYDFDFHHTAIYSWNQYESKFKNNLYIY